MVNQKSELNGINLQNPAIQSPPADKACYKLWLIGYLILLVIVAAVAYIFGSKQVKPNPVPTPRLTTISPSESSSSSESFVGSDFPEVENNPEITIKPEESDGTMLSDIKYTLPPNWSAKITDTKLYISPNSGGGFLSIQVYDYTGNTGRREYYCQVSNICIDGTTYFNETSIGNISGYIANALDNSGGGPEYFGAKGNKFYIIGSYNPPSPNEFEKNYDNVLNSLVF